MKNRNILLGAALLILAMPVPFSLAGPILTSTPAATPPAAPAATAPAAPTATAPASTVMLPPNTCLAASLVPLTPAPDTSASGNTSGGDPSTISTPGAATAQPQTPQLVDKASMTCADGKLQVIVTARPYEYHFGDNIQVTVLIGVADGAKIDLNPLVKQGQLYADGSGPFELASTPSVKTESITGGTLYQLTLVVRQFLPGPFTSFTMQVPYSVASAPNGSPMWEPLQTPAFTIMQDVNGAPAMSQPTTGNTGLSQPRGSWATAPSVVLMVIMLLLWPTIAIVRLVNRVRPRRTTPPAVSAWLAFNRVKASGKEIGYSANHYARLSQIIKLTLNDRYPGVIAMPASTIARSFAGDAKITLAISALSKIERVLVNQATLTADEHQLLLREVDQLIPRPLSL